MLDLVLERKLASAFKEWCRAAGEAVWEQMELDMFRMAALYVVERLKPQLFSYLTAVLSAAYPTPSRCGWLILGLHMCSLSVTGNLHMALVVGCSGPAAQPFTTPQHTV